MTATAELCRDIAEEATRRGALGNVHELWAVLEFLNDVPEPELIVDVGGTPAAWWAWWAVCPNVIGVSRLGSAQTAFERLPSTVVAIDADPTDSVTAQRVVDQVGRRTLDVLVLSGATSGEQVRNLWRLYAPKVKAGGVVLVRGIANPATPGVVAFWRDLDTEFRDELVGANDPDGYGIVTIPGWVSSNG